jgi:hypothetical protein
MYDKKTYRLTAAEAVFPLTDTVNVNCCPDDVPPLDTVGGLTDSTIF